MPSRPERAPPPFPADHFGVTPTPPPQSKTDAPEKLPNYAAIQCAHLQRIVVNLRRLLGVGLMVLAVQFAICGGVLLRGHDPRDSGEFALGGLVVGILALALFLYGSVVAGTPD